MKSRTLLVGALLLTISLTALDTTVVSTAMPTIVGSLGGLSLFSWVFSAYLLASTVTVPIYGKLADLYGRKPVLLFGISLFLFGSALSGMAGSMVELILFRAIQGLGAGAVMPVTMTIIGDLFPIEQRARIQGLTGSVWGIAAIAGPAIGGVLTDEVSWRWIFYLNLPLGAAAVAMVLLQYSETKERRQHKIDYWGAALLSGAIVSLLMGLLQGVRVYGWASLETLALFVLATGLLAVFVRHESKTSEPIVPLSLFRNKIIVISSLGGFLGGASLFGVNAYVPLFSQGVLGGSAVDAGIILAPMSVAWTSAAYTSGRTIVRFGYYPSAIAGTGFLVLGSGGLLTITSASPIFVLMGAVFVVGLGLGFTTSAFMISVQNAASKNQRGIATASTLFFRSIGGAISVAVMGAVLNSGMSRRLEELADVPAGTGVNSLLSPDFRNRLDAGALEAMSKALAASLHDVYLLAFGAAVLALAAVAFFPRGRAEELAHREETGWAEGTERKEQPASLLKAEAVKMATPAAPAPPGTPAAPATSDALDDAKS